MGCNCSKGKQASGLSADAERTHDRIVEMLKLKQIELAQSENKVTFSKILMKASSLCATYRRIFEVYRSLDENGDGHLDDEELEVMIERLGVSHEVSATDLNSIKELCDIDGDHTISLKEFIVTLTILYLLKAVPALRSKTKFMDQKECQRVLGAVDLLMLEGDGEDNAAAAAAANGGGGAAADETNSTKKMSTSDQITKAASDKKKEISSTSPEKSPDKISFASGTAPPAKILEENKAPDLDLYGSSDNKPPPPASGTQSPVDNNGNPVFLGFSADIHYLVHWVVAAYLIFDDQCRGCIARSTIQLMQKQNHDDGNDLFLQEDRWRELDWDQNGEVSFEEFVFAFSQWIRDFSGDLGDDDEEEEDGKKAQTESEEEQPAVIHTKNLN